MIIKCNTVEAFLENIKGSDLFQEIVFIDITSRGMGDNQRSSTSFEIIFQASTIIQYGEGDQALLQMGLLCGIDRHTGDGGLEGTEKAIMCRAQIEEYCAEHDKKVKPGILNA